jgi:CRISPR/Cas system CSM-associated protein Csm3 (group 7 of RAMP superfamily)
VNRFAELSFVLAFDGPLQVNDPAAALANALSFAPVFASPYWADPVLPGSSVRGVLRSQVERIARTLATRAAGGDLARFAAACGACDPFRSYPSDAVAPALASCAARDDRAEKTRKASLPAADAGVSPAPGLCAGCELFGSTVQGSRLWIADAPIDSEAEYRLRDFVAIDRFTGGALEHAKFDALPLYSPRFRVSLLLWQHADGELGALSLALRDVHDGLVTFGAHGSRGFGRARVVDVSLSVGRVERRPERDVREEEWSGVFHCERSAFVDAEALVKAAREKGWVEALVSRSQLPRKEPPDAGEPSDTYLGVRTAAGPTLAQLYPAVVDLSRLEAAHG